MIHIFLVQFFLFSSYVFLKFWKTETFNLTEEINFLSIWFVLLSRIGTYVL